MEELEELGTSAAYLCQTAYVSGMNFEMFSIRRPGENFLIKLSLKFRIKKLRMHNT